MSGSRNSACLCPLLLRSGGGLVHQSLDCDAHLHQAFLLQDVVRKTQSVLEDSRTERSIGADGEAERDRRAAQDLDNSVFE